MSSQPWFFAPPEDWTGDAVLLPADESHHALRVLRVAPMDVITVTDGHGAVARCGVSGEEQGRLRAEVLERTQRDPLRPRIVVYQGAAKGSKLDDVVEKLGELGVAEMWAFESERSVVRWDAKKVARLAERWSAIGRSVSKQSRNPYSIEAGAGLSWTELIRRVSKEHMSITLWEEASLPMRAALHGMADRIAVVVGPEGGFTREEAEALADAGSPLVSMGPRILRTENAALVAASALAFHFGLVG